MKAGGTKRKPKLFDPKEALIKYLSPPKARKDTHKYVIREAVNSKQRLNQCFPKQFGIGEYGG